MIKFFFFKYIKFTRLRLLLYSALLYNYIQNKHSAYIEFERLYSNFMCTESQQMSDVQILIGYLCVTQCCSHNVYLLECLTQFCRL